MAISLPVMFIAQLLTFWLMMLELLISSELAASARARAMITNHQSVLMEKGAPHARAPPMLLAVKRSKLVRLPEVIGVH